MPDPGFHPRYKELLRVNGKILDADENSVLYSTLVNWPEFRLYRYDLKSRSHVLISTNFGEQAELIPGGVLMQEASTNGDGRIIEFGTEEPVVLGEGRIPAEYHGNHVVNGRYGALHLGDGTVLRDFVGRTNYVISEGVRARYLDVAANGNVIFTTSVQNEETGYTHTIHWWDQGSLQTVALVESGYGPHVQTDGTNYLWSVPDTSVFGTVNLQTPSELLVLDDQTFMDDRPPDYSQPNFYTKPSAMVNGWTAYERRVPNASLYSPWRRSPAGEIQPATSFPAYIKALRADGGLLVTTGGEVWFVPPAGEPKRLSPEFAANCFFVGEQLYAYTDSRFFEVDVEGAPFALTSPVFDSGRQVFTYNIYASEPGDFALERSTDFVNWATVATESVTNIYPQAFEVAAEPGFFRLKRLMTSEVR